MCYARELYFSFPVFKEHELLPRGPPLPSLHTPGGVWFLRGCDPEPFFSRAVLLGGGGEHGRAEIKLRLGGSPLRGPGTVGRPGFTRAPGLRAALRMIRRRHGLVDHPEELLLDGSELLAVLLHGPGRCVRGAAAPRPRPCCGQVGLRHHSVLRARLSGFRSQCPIYTSSLRL